MDLTRRKKKEEASHEQQAIDAKRPKTKKEVRRAQEAMYAQKLKNEAERHTRFDHNTADADKRKKMYERWQNKENLFLDLKVHELSSLLATLEFHFGMPEKLPPRMVKQNRDFRSINNDKKKALTDIVEKTAETAVTMFKYVPGSILECSLTYKDKVIGRYTITTINATNITICDDWITSMKETKQKTTDYGNRAEIVNFIQRSMNAHEMANPPLPTINSTP
jgi:hypothetical protein